MNIRSCTVCDLPISPARLAAKPTASQCVACLEAGGDVPLVRRHGDSYFIASFATQTMLTDLARSMQTIPSDTAFHVGIGEDGAYGGRPRNSVGATGSFADEITPPKETTPRRNHGTIV